MELSLQIIQWVAGISIPAIISYVKLSQVVKTVENTLEKLEAAVDTVKDKVSETDKKLAVIEHRLQVIEDKQSKIN